MKKILKLTILLFVLIVPAQPLLPIIVYAQSLPISIPTNLPEESSPVPAGETEPIESHNEPVEFAFRLSLPTDQFSLLDNEQVILTNKLKVVLGGESNQVVKFYRFGFNSDLTSEPWIELQNPANVINQDLDIDITDLAIGNHELTIELKTVDETISPKLQAQFVKKYFDIRPEIKLDVTPQLVAGQLSQLNIAIRNLGSDTAYNGNIELVLPREVKLGDISSDEENLLPSLQQEQADRTTLIRYSSIADLLSQQTKIFSLPILVDINSKPGDQVNFIASLNVSPRPDLNVIVSNENKLTMEVQPLRIEVKSSNEQLIESDQNREIVITSGTPQDVWQDPEATPVPSMEVLYKLDNATEYVEDSQRVEGIDPASVIFNFIPGGEDGAIGKTLQWLFFGILPVNPISIFFQTNLPSASDDQEQLQHNQQVTDLIEVKTADGFTHEQVNNTLAKYLLMVKTSSNASVVPGDVVEMSIRLQTSAAYNFDYIDITDELPNGMVLSESTDLPSSVSMISYVDNQIVWRVNNLSANQELVFKYMVTISESYTSSGLLLSADNLTGKLSFIGHWYNNTQEGEVTDDKDHTIKVAKPLLYLEGGKDGQNYTNTILATIGDFVNVKTVAQFPNVTTANTNLRIYLPLGSTIVGQPRMDNGELEFEQTSDGWIFKLGDVAKAKRIEINYQLQIADDPALRIATKVRNIAVLSYDNSQGRRQQHIVELPIDIAEPRIEANVEINNGYHAPGEEFEVQVKLHNVGNHSAYNLEWNQQIPISWEIVTSPNDPTIAASDGKFSGNTSELAAGDTIVYKFKAKLKPDQQPGNYLDTVINISKYSNYQNANAVTRSYSPAPFNFNFMITEPAFITMINMQGYPADGNITTYRNQEWILQYQIRNVGGAPAYNLLASLQLPTDPIVINGDAEVFINGKQQDLLINNQNQLELTKLLPGEQLVINFPVMTKRWALWGARNEIRLSTTAQRADLSNVTKDARPHISGDWDVDDESTTVIAVSRELTRKPAGLVRFKVDDILVGITNKTEAQVEYLGFDPAGEIIGARMSDDGENWGIPGVLENNQLLNVNEMQLLDIGGLWLRWPENTSENPAWSVITNLQANQLNYKYLQLIDLDGNITTINGGIIVDTLAPIYGEFVISPIANDMVNLPATSRLDNYLNFYAVEQTYLTPDNSVGQVGEVAAVTSGLGEYRYRIQSQDWSGWQPMVDGINAVPIRFNAVDNKDNLFAEIEIRDLAGNVYAEELVDTIIYDTAVPILGFTLPNINGYTGEQILEPELQLISNYPVSRYRFSSDFSPMSDLSTDEWLDAEDGISIITSPEGVTGQRFICMQVMISTLEISNVSCQKIIYDPLAPQLAVELLSPIISTLPKVELKLDSTDPLLHGGLLGSGELQHQIKVNGTIAIDWAPLQPYIELTLPDKLGLNVLTIVVKDRIGNISYPTEIGITYDKLGGTGGIIINYIPEIAAGALFTDTSLANLKLNWQQVGLSQRPVLMRFTSTYGSTLPAEPPPAGQPYNPDGEWSHWEEFVENKEWDLEPATVSPKWGQYNIYVQYLMPNGVVSSMLWDSIIYAPVYKVDWSSSLAELPTETLASSDLEFNVSGENNGSLTWYSGEHNPVGLIYSWQLLTPAESQLGFGGAANSVSGLIHLDETIGYKNLLNQAISINTPIYPGIYQLTIDLLHDGVTTFAQQGNNPITQQVTVIQNPDRQLPNEGINPDTGLPWDIGDEEAGIGRSYYSGMTKTFVGVLQVAPPGQGYNYRIYDEEWQEWWGFNLNNNNGGIDALVGQRVEVPVRFTGNGTSFVLSGNVRLASQIWEMALVDQGPAIIHAYRGDRIIIQPKFANTGTGRWVRSEVHLQATVGFDFFDASTWRDSQTQYLDQNLVAGGSMGTFTFALNIPNSLVNGSYEFCTKAQRPNTTWNKRDKICYTVHIESTEAEQVAFQCSLPQPIYTTKGGNQIGVLSNSQQLVVLSNETGWLRIYHPYESGQQAWVEDTIGCFQSLTQINNPIQKTVPPITPRPDGDNGYVIRISGVDLKSGPSDLFNNLGRLDYGTSVKVLGQFKGTDVYGGWLKVQTSDGKVGYVPIGMIDHVNTPESLSFNIRPAQRDGYVCQNSLTVREGPGSQYRTLTTLAYGTQTKMLQEWQGWYLISYTSTGKSGWVINDHVCAGFYQPVTYTGSVAGVGYVNGVAYSRPLPNYVLTSGYGAPRAGGTRQHLGTDYVYPVANTCDLPIYAIADGQVSVAIKGAGMFDKDRQNEIHIVHPDGVMSRYVHVYRVYVNRGQQVKRGQVIATIGSNGNSTGCHLHLETLVKSNGKYVYVNPETFLQQATSRGTVAGTTNTTKNATPAPVNNKDPFGSATFQNKNLNGQINFNYHINTPVLFGQFGKGISYISGNVSAPIITKVDVINNGTTVRVYGVSFSEQTNITVKVENDFLDCSTFICSVKREQVQLTKKIPHVYLSLYDQKGNEIPNGGLWINNSNGRFTIDIPVNGYARYGGKIYAKTKLYGEVNSSNELKKWHDWSESDVKLGLPNNGVLSSNSNMAIIPDFKPASPAELAIRKEEQRLAKVVRDGVIHQWCGLSIQDYSDINGKGDAVIIYNPKRDKAYSIYGGIWWSYYTYGGCDVFGAPVGNEGESGDKQGWYQHFEKANIYWNKGITAAQPGVVQGNIRNKFESMGGSNSFLGFPLGWRWEDQSRCGTQGSIQKFVGGRVYDSRYGTYAMANNRWMEHYLAQNETSSNYGFPRDELKWTDGKERWDMESGTMEGAWNLAHWYIRDSYIGCTNFDFQRQDDPNVVGKVPIHNSEMFNFASMMRSKGAKGIIHTTTCGGEQYDVVYYDEATLFSGETLNNVAMVYHHSTKTLNGLAGSTVDYFFNGGCVGLGRPTSSTAYAIRPKYYAEDLVDWGTFANGVAIYDYATSKVITVTQCAAGAYANAEGGSYVNSYIGKPVSSLKNYDKFIFEGVELTNVSAQEFKGGHILIDIKNKECVVSPDIVGQSKKFGKPIFDLGSAVSSIAEGFKLGIEGVFKSIPESILDVAVSVATTVLGATSPLGIILKGGYLVYSLIQIIDAVNSLGAIIPRLEKSFAAGDYNFPLMLTAMLVSGITATLMVPSIADNVIYSIKNSVLKLDNFANTFGDSVRNASNELKTNLMKLARSDEGKQLDILRNTLEITGGQVLDKLKGDLSKLGDDELSNIAILASKLDRDVHVDEIKSLNLKGLLKSLSAQQLDNITWLIDVGRKDLNIDEFAKLPIEGSIKGITDTSKIDNLLTIAKKGVRVEVGDYLKYAGNISGDVAKLSNSQVKIFVEIAKSSTKVDVDNYIGLDNMLTASDKQLGGGLGHWYSRHVNVSEDDVMNRFINEPNIPQSSAFYDESIARQAILKALHSKDGVDAMNAIKAGVTEVKFTYNLPNMIGYGYVNTSSGLLSRVSPDIDSIFILLRSNNGQPYMHTAYPN